MSLKDRFIKMFKCYLLLILIISSLLQNNPVHCTVPRDSRWGLWRSPGFLAPQNTHKKRMNAVCRLSCKRKPAIMLLEYSRRNRQNHSQGRMRLTTERRKGNEGSPMTPLHSRELARMLRVQEQKVILIPAQPIIEMQRTSYQGRLAKHRGHFGTMDYIISMGLELHGMGKI